MDNLGLDVIDIAALKLIAGWLIFDMLNVWLIWFVARAVNVYIRFVLGIRGFRDSIWLILLAIAFAGLFFAALWLVNS